MDLLNQHNAMKLIMSVLERTVKPSTIIKYKPAKTRTVSGAKSTPLPVCLPEDEGVSSDYLARFVREVADDPDVRLHTLIISRHGRIVAKTAAAPYSFDNFHTAFSLSKSVTGLAIGMLVDDGKLSTGDPVWKILDKKLSPLSASRQKNITVEDLLTMRSGIVFAEAGSVTEEHWRRGFFDSASNNKGEFAYNSMNSYMLAAIVCEITGMTLSEFLQPRLFEPLGIGDYFWEKCPDGIEKGGFGLYCRPEDMLKFGLVYMNGGMYGGKRIVSREWIDKAVTIQVQTPESVSTFFDYGYHVWIGREPDSILLNGMLGQNVMVFPESGFAVGICAGQSDMFHENIFFDYCRKYFGAGTESNYQSEPLSANPHGAARLIRQCAAGQYVAPAQTGQCAPKLQSGRTDVVKRLAVLDKTRLPLTFGNVFTKKEGSDEAENLRVYGPSLMPLTLAMIQNNYSNPICAVEFKCGGSKFYITFIEESSDGKSDGVRRELPVAFSGRAETLEFDFNGEKYSVAATGKLSYSEDGVPVLTIAAAFAETASTRIVRFYFERVKRSADGDTLEVRAQFSETPGAEMIVDSLGQVIRSATMSKFVENAIERADFSYGDIVEYKIEATMAPHGHGFLHAIE